MYIFIKLNLQTRGPQKSCQLKRLSFVEGPNHMECASNKALSFAVKTDNEIKFCEIRLFEMSTQLSNCKLIFCVT